MPHPFAKGAKGWPPAGGHRRPGTLATGHHLPITCSASRPEGLGIFADEIREGLGFLKQNLRVTPRSSVVSPVASRTVFKADL